MFTILSRIRRIDTEYAALQATRPLTQRLVRGLVVSFQTCIEVEAPAHEILLLAVDHVQLAGNSKSRIDVVRLRETPQMQDSQRNRPMKLRLCRRISHANPFASLLAPHFGIDYSPTIHSVAPMTGYVIQKRHSLPIVNTNGKRERHR